MAACIALSTGLLAAGLVDVTAVEPVRGDLKEGDLVVTRVVDPNEAANAGNPNQNRNVMGPGFVSFPGGGGRSR